MRGNVRGSADGEGVFHRVEDSMPGLASALSRTPDAPTVTGEVPVTHDGGDPVALGAVGDLAVLAKVEAPHGRRPCCGLLRLIPAPMT